jgi:membrane associated rhomboid family serine protease
MTEPLLEKLTARRERQSDDRLGMVLVALGVAIALAPVIASDNAGDIRAGLAAALFPLLVGGVLWLRYYAAERAKRRERAE